jgi:selenocysteine-specific elongation factor
MRVVATAGHVDHGKSTLVRSLTGTDPDRWDEEKRRGLTIDLGFAFTTLPSGTEVGFVDVPGHTRFVKNMLAGVGAVDVALLVVAANEGWKPQSEEHLRILDLLDIRHGLVVITKADLVDAEHLECTTLEVLEHLEGTTLANAPIVACAPPAGLGLDAVRTALDQLLGAIPPPSDLDRPRLWIDRVFTAKGAGTVVTGTLTGGAIAVDDQLRAGGFDVRVRGIQQEGHAVQRAAAGERVALNLVGVDHQHLARGDAVVRADQWRAVEVVDVEITELPGAELRRRGRAAAAVGSGDHRVWCRRIDDRFARLRFPAPVPVAPGDRIVLRDTGRDRTVAGARVLDLEPVTRAAAAPDVLARPLGARILARGWVAATDLGPLTGLPPDAATTAIADAGGEAVGTWFVAGATATALRDDLAARVHAHHQARPGDPGLGVSAAARALRLAPEQVEALVATTPTLTSAGGALHERGHRGDPETTPEGLALIAALDTTPFAPPPPGDPALARALARAGALVELDGVWFTATAVAEARDRVVAALAERGELTIADARDVLDSTRKYVVPLMGHLDATGVTRRRGDVRVPGPRSGLAAN